MTGGWNVVIQNATVRDNIAAVDSDGINVAGTKNFTVENCSIYGNDGGASADGIHVATGTTGGIIRWNRIYDNENADIILDDATNNDCQIYYNLLGQAVGNSKYGIYLKSATTTVYNNTIAGLYNTSGGAGIFVDEVATGDTATIKNNLIATETQKCMAIDSGILGTVVLDYNSYYNPGNVIVDYEGTTYTDLSTYQAAEPTQDQNAVGTDPLFESSSDRQLQELSPCREAGTGVSLTLDYIGEMVPKGVAVDIGCYEMDLVLIATGPLDHEQVIRTVYDGVALGVCHTGAASGDEGTSPLDAEQVWKASFNITEGKLRVVR